MVEKTYIVLLNWNGWADTIECMQSVFALDREDDFHVVVCDNGSTDGSVEHIVQWLRGDLCPIGALPDEYYERDHAINNPPITYQGVSRSQVDHAAGTALTCQCSIISIGENLGYAGGCNVGIGFSLQQNDCGYVWLLNNDTVVTRSALSQLLKKVNQSEDLGVCGSTLVYYDQPHLIQALGGAKYYPCIGYSRHVGAHQSLVSDDIAEIREEAMSYIVGASFLVRAGVFRDIGLLNEEYFLYCEEIDFCNRMKGRYRIAHAGKSIVYHKEGATIGGSSIRPEKSDTSLYYAVSSRIKLTRNFYRYCLPLVYMVTILRMLLLMSKRNFHQARLVLKILRG